jgi:hypothetical protein
MWHPRTTGRYWITLAERSFLRAVFIVLGFALMVVGLALGVTMIMLPAGVVIGLIGVGLVVWGAFGDVPIAR